jgi:hypothetical protein
MKTTYWLVAAAAVAAGGVTVYTRLAANGPPLPNVPLTAEKPPTAVPRLTLPPVVIPPDEPLALPVPDAPAGSPPLPLPESKPVSKPDAPPVPTTKPMADPVSPVEPASAVVPLIPPLPVLPPPMPAPFAVPGPTPVLAVPPAPVEPAVPALPAPVRPESPSAAPPAPKPGVSAPPALVSPAPPKPLPLPAPSVLQPPVGPTPAKPLPLPVGVGAAPLAGAGKYVLLKDDKLIEGGVTVHNDTVVVRQGALDRPFHKSQVQYVASSRDEVYRFMLAKVPAADAAARLGVAKWCMFGGLREQALAEAREVLTLQPTNKHAADMVRSLELSLREFPAEDSPRMSAPAAPTFPVELRHDPVPMPVPAAPAIPPAAPVPPAVLDPEPDVTPEAALVFGARVQPFLANQCIECHAKPDHAGTFKLVKVDPVQAGPMATRTNLRAVAGQLRKDDPGASPLLLKSLSAHGGMKLPATTRQSTAYQTLEAWAVLAIGTPSAVAAPVPQPIPVPSVAEPVLPPVPADPPAPRPLPVPPAATDPLLPPAPAPVAPLPKPVLPPAPAVPAIPPADVPVPVLPPVPRSVPVPAIPPIPPASALPKPPSAAVPAGGTFGTAVPPKTPASGPAGGDEFDPAGFNQGRK